jgi:hypothetical protein
MKLIPEWLKSRRALLEELNEERQTVKELEGLFDRAWEADMRAIKRWQEAHPGNNNVWPGRTDLVVWLMEQSESRESDTAAPKDKKPDSVPCSKCKHNVTWDGRFGTNCNADDCKFSTRPRLLNA